jgi:hypothetical protein
LGVVTVTSTVPIPGGLVATICESELTANQLAGRSPKVTAVAPEKPPPVMVTGVPPVAGPDAGLTPDRPTTTPLRTSK